MTTDPSGPERLDPAVESGLQAAAIRLSRRAVAIQAHQTYAATLAAAGVQGGTQQVADWITAAATAAGSVGQPDLPDELFDELVDLVESPTLIQDGSTNVFLPCRGRLSTGDADSHQRYVPLVRARPSRPAGLGAPRPTAAASSCIGKRPGRRPKPQVQRRGLGGGETKRWPQGPLADAGVLSWRQIGAIPSAAKPLAAARRSPSPKGWAACWSGPSDWSELAGCCLDASRPGGARNGSGTAGPPTSAARPRQPDGGRIPRTPGR